MSYHYSPSGKLDAGPPSIGPMCFIIGTILVLIGLALHEFFAGMP